MKIFVHIVCIYVLYLVSLPCVDGVSDVCTRKTEQSPKPADGHENQHHHTCSPFCVCSCCNVTVVITKYLVQKKPSRLTQPAFIPFYEKITSVYYSNIWQPPKA